MLRRISSLHSRSWPWMAVTVALVCQTACYRNGGGTLPATAGITGPATIAVGANAVASVQTIFPDDKVLWSIQGGSFNGSQAAPTTRVVSFTASQAGKVHLSCFIQGVQGNEVLTLEVLAQGPAAQAPNLSAPAWATAGQGGYTASVAQPVANWTYAWAIDGGTLAASTGPSVGFSAGQGPQVTLTCTATGPDGTIITATTAVAVVPAPAMPTIAVPAQVPRDPPRWPRCRAATRGRPMSGPSTARAPSPARPMHPAPRW